MDNHCPFCGKYHSDDYTCLLCKADLSPRKEYDLSNLRSVLECPECKKKAHKYWWDCPKLKGTYYFL
jgi:hypothetical protein